MIPGFASAWRITQDAVVKISPNPSEPFIMSYLSSNTSIPIPQVRRVLPWRQQDLYQDQKYVIMDYVDGDLLELAWPTMSWWARIRVIWFMRSHLRQLHRLPLPFPGLPGPFDAHGNSYMCSGFFFTSTGGGPFRSYREMADWFDHRRFDALVYAHRCSGAVNKWWPKFDRTQPLVLCHMDLHMNNIIVDRKGMPWIIDWGRAGAFPAWLEYAHLVIWDERSPKSWIWSARFMVGNYGKYVTDFLNKLYFCWEGPLIDEPLDYFTNLGLDVD